MKLTRLLLSGIICFVILNSINGKEVKYSDAKRVATNFFYEKINEIQSTDYNSIIISETYTEMIGGINTYFIFNIYGKGYVVVSADDNTIPVLAYSFEENYSDKNISPTFESWMNSYSNEILYIKEESISSTKEIQEEWKHYLTQDISELSIVFTNSIGPLCTSTWDQSSYYNAMCPEDQNGPGGHALVGCVATTMAQIMYYYRYPAQGTGSHSYYADFSNWGYADYGYQYVDFGNTTYDWNSMIDNIGNSPNPAVSELSYHCGVSVNMMYSATKSGAYSGNVPTALKNYFKYAPSAQLKNKNNYNNTQWANMLIANLNDGKPLYYHGYGSSGGHAFVCDGYQGSNYFHFNWGWGGSYDGYFYLNNLNPGYNFSSGQGAIFDIYPGSNYPTFCTGTTTTLTAKTGTFVDGSGPSDYQNNSNCNWLIVPIDSVTSIELSFVSFNTENSFDKVTVYDGSTTADPVLAVFSGNNIPPTVISTGDKMLVTFATNGNSTSSGWSANYSSTLPIYCQGNTHLTDPSGTISDGSGPKLYNNLTVCNWRIEPPGAKTVTLTFNNFDTELTYDFVKVYDPSTNPATVLGIYSGSSLPQPVTSHGGSMFVLFFSNNNTAGGGFEATYTSSTSGYITNEFIENLNIFPNPANGRLNIQFNLMENQQIKFELVNTTGENIYSMGFENVSGSFNKSLNLSGFSNGVYFLRIIGEKNITTKKIILY